MTFVDKSTNAGYNKITKVVLPIYLGSNGVLQNSQFCSIPFFNIKIGTTNQGLVNWGLRNTNKEKPCLLRVEHADGRRYAHDVSFCFSIITYHLVNSSFNSLKDSGL